MKKTYQKSGRSCRVTFQLPQDVLAEEVALCGDFNDWSMDKNPMQKRKDGNFSTTISLTPGNSYRFRYLIDGERWENDWDADEYVPNEFGTKDLVVIV